jgi:hypothetical protein
MTVHERNGGKRSKTGLALLLVPFAISALACSLANCDPDDEDLHVFVAEIRSNSGETTGLKVIFISDGSKSKGSRESDGYYLEVLSTNASFLLAGEGISSMSSEGGASRVCVVLNSTRELFLMERSGRLSHDARVVIKLRKASESKDSEESGEGEGSVPPCEGPLVAETLWPRGTGTVGVNDASVPEDATAPTDAAVSEDASQAAR